MKVRLLAPLAALAAAAIVAATPATAAEPSGAATPQGLSALLAPAPTGLGDNWSDSGGGMPSNPWGSNPWGASTMGGLGYPGGFWGPWWAGQSIYTISAATGGTWPFAPWYWTPQWWTMAASGGGR